MRKRGMVLLLSLLLLLTAACSPGEGGADGERNTDISAELEYEDSMELLYAEKFSVDYYTGGFSLVTVNGSERYLVVPEGKESPGDLAEDITVLYQPLDRIYLVCLDKTEIISKVYEEQRELLDKVRVVLDMC